MERMLSIETIVAACRAGMRRDHPVQHANRFPLDLDLRPFMADAPLRGDGPDAAEVRLNRLLNLILESAVEALHFDAATVTARHGQDMATVAATDEPFIALDDAQYESGEGPCLTVLEPHDPISLDDAGELDDQ